MYTTIRHELRHARYDLELFAFSLFWNLYMHMQLFVKWPWPWGKHFSCHICWSFWRSIGDDGTAKAVWISKAAGIGMTAVFPDKQLPAAGIYKLSQAWQNCYPYEAREDVRMSKQFSTGRKNSVATSWQSFLAFQKKLSTFIPVALQNRRISLVTWHFFIYVCLQKAGKKIESVHIVHPGLVEISDNYFADFSAIRRGRS